MSTTVMPVVVILYNYSNITDTEAQIVHANIFFVDCVCDSTKSVHLFPIYVYWQHFVQVLGKNDKDDQIFPSYITADNWTSKDDGNLLPPARFWLSTQTRSFLRENSIRPIGKSCGWTHNPI